MAKSATVILKSYLKKNTKLYCSMIGAWRPLTSCYSKPVRRALTKNTEICQQTCSIFDKVVVFFGKPIIHCKRLIEM